MDHLLDRVEALTQQLQTLQQQSTPCSSTPTPSNVSSAGGGAWPAACSGWRCSPGRCRPSPRKKTPLTRGQQGLAQRVAALETLLKHFSREGNDVTIKGANLHLVNGLGSTDCGDEQASRFRTARTAWAT